MWFKRKKKPKPIKHDIRSAAGIPCYRNFYSAVRCERCGKQYIMDVFGGWAVEWEFELDSRWSVNKENFAMAEEKYHNTKPQDWGNLSYDNCEEG